MASRPRVVVAGAGVIGTVCALTLARAGASVTWLDPSLDVDGLCAPNASAVAAGMLAPAFEAVFDAESPPISLMRRARDLWPGLAASVGIRLDCQGALAVGSTAEVEAWAGRLESLGVQAEALAPWQVAEQAPWLASRSPGLFTYDDWRLSPPATLAALRAAVQDRWVTVASVAVTGWVSGAALVLGAHLPADALVIATGASRALQAAAPELAVLTPIKGHILRAPGAARSGPVVRMDGLYVCPDEAGALVGATMEPGIADPAVDPAVAEGLIQRLRARAPTLAAAPLEARAGVRAATPDGLPLAGPSAVPGVWLAAGARRNGWLLAPLIGETLAAAVLGQPPPSWADTLDPRRFAGERGVCTPPPSPDSPLRAPPPPRRTARAGLAGEEERIRGDLFLPPPSRSAGAGEVARRAFPRAVTEGAFVCG